MEISNDFKVVKINTNSTIYRALAQDKQGKYAKAQLMQMMAYKSMENVNS